MIDVCIIYVSPPRVVFRVTIGAIYKRNLYDSRYAFVGLTQFLFQIPCTYLPEYFV